MDEAIDGLTSGCPEIMDSVGEEELPLGSILTSTVFLELVYVAPLLFAVITQ